MGFGTPGCTTLSRQVPSHHLGLQLLLPLPGLCTLPYIPAKARLKSGHTIRMHQCLQTNSYFPTPGSSQDGRTRTSKERGDRQARLSPMEILTFLAPSCPQLWSSVLLLVCCDWHLYDSSSLSHKTGRKVYSLLLVAFLISLFTNQAYSKGPQPSPCRLTLWNVRVVYARQTENVS